MLIDTARLAHQVGDPTWVLFDCRHDLMDKSKGERLYAASHLPGAHFARVETDLSGTKTGKNGRHPLPDAQALADFFGSHGVTPDSTIVAYDDVGGQYAARLWWLARWIGLKRVGLLDGGWPKWVAEGRPVTTDVPVARPARIEARPDASLLWTVADVAANLDRPSAVVLDARTPERYRGESEPIDTKAGHIPGAHNRFFKLNLNADLTFRSPADLRRDFEELAAAAGGRPFVHQCGSGVTACVNLFAMEHAGLPGSRLFVGSWSEWIADPARPIATGPRP